MPSHLCVQCGFAVELLELDICQNCGDPIHICCLEDLNKRYPETPREQHHWCWACREIAAGTYDGENKQELVEKIAAKRKEEIQLMFPNVEFNPNLAGHISYSPWVTMLPSVMEQLPDALEEAELVYASDCENADVLADWRMVKRADVITHRSNIICYRDGSDYIPEDEEIKAGEWPNIGLLFCRQDIDQEREMTTYRVHVPRHDDQQQLLDAAEHWLQDRTGEKFKVLNDYLQGVINTPSSWKTLEEF